MIDVVCGQCEGASMGPEIHSESESSGEEVSGTETSANVDEFLAQYLNSTSGMSCDTASRSLCFRVVNFKSKLSG